MWLSSVETVVNIDRFVHYTLYSLLVPSGVYNGRKHCTQKVAILEFICAFTEMKVMNYFCEAMMSLSPLFLVLPNVPSLEVCIETCWIHVSFSYFLCLSPLNVSPNLIHKIMFYSQKFYHASATVVVSGHICTIPLIELICLYGSVVYLGSLHPTFGYTDERQKAMDCLMSSYREHLYDPTQRRTLILNFAFSNVISCFMKHTKRYRHQSWSVRYLRQRVWQLFAYGFSFNSSSFCFNTQEEYTFVNIRVYHSSQYIRIMIRKLVVWNWSTEKWMYVYVT
jgi:hypothetical protein